MTDDPVKPEAGALRVCFVTERYPPQTGGVAVAAHRLVKYLVSAGYRVTVFHPFQKDSGAWEALRAEEDGAQVLRLKYSLWGEESAVALLRLIVGDHRERPFDIFHGFFLTVVKNCTFASEYCAGELGSRPVIASIRGSDALDRLLYPYWREAICEGLRKSTWITSVNRYYLDHVASEFGLDIAGRSSVIRNGVAAVPRPKRWQLTEANRGTVGTVGAFRMIKDIPLLVRGYAALPGHLRKRLLLAGFFEPAEPEEERWSNTLIEEFGIRGQVCLTGPFAPDEAGTHLRGMHVYAQTSAYEGLPNSLLEAAAHGVPLVATAVGGVAEILTHGATGLLVPHGEPAALTGAIEQVLRDDRLAQRLSDGAIRLASELNCENERSQWLALYRSLTHETVSQPGRVTAPLP